MGSATSQTQRKHKVKVDPSYVRKLAREHLGSGGDYSGTPPVLPDVEQSQMATPTEKGSDAPPMSEAALSEATSLMMPNTAKTSTKNNPLLKEYADIGLDYIGTPYKLESGEWGAKITHFTGGTPQPSDIVEITTSAGESWITKVTKVIWSDHHTRDKVSLVAVADPPISPRLTARRINDTTVVIENHETTKYTTKRRGDTAVITAQRGMMVLRWRVNITAWSCRTWADYTITTPEGELTNGWDSGPYGGAGIAMREGIADAMRMAREHPHT